MGEFKGKHTGYKAYIRDKDSALILITLLYDKAKKDPAMKDALYSRLCFVKEIEVFATGEKIDSVHGHCSSCAYTYTKNRFILNEKIYFFPESLRNAPERAINYAQNQNFLDHASDDLRAKLLMFAITHVRKGKLKGGNPNELKTQRVRRGKRDCLSAQISRDQRLPE